MRVLLAVAVISGCAASELPEPERGSLAACLGGPDVVTGADGDFDITVEGVVVERFAWDYNLAPCGGVEQGVQIEDAEGQIWSLGLGILDEDNKFVRTPRLAPKGRQVSFTYRYRHPWGDVSGFVLSDVDGIVAVVEEGSWGGALREDDVPGLEVNAGKKIIAEEETDCAPLIGYDLHFKADSHLTLPPVESEAIEIEGRPYVAHAISAHEDGIAENGCEIADTPGIFAWAITR